MQFNLEKVLGPWGIAMSLTHLTYTNQMKTVVPSYDLNTIQTNHMITKFKESYIKKKNTVPSLSSLQFSPNFGSQSKLDVKYATLK